MRGERGAEPTVADAEFLRHKLHVQVSPELYKALLVEGIG
jgi:hypothetical protein